MSVGKGTKVGAELRGIIEEVEAVDERMKQMRESRAAILAEAKAKGFDVKTIRKLIALRKQKAEEREEAQNLLDTYMHALGMAEPAPLFASIGTMSVDPTAREELIEAFKGLVPATGEIIMKLGGKPIRLFRDAEGDAQAEDYIEASAPRASRAASPVLAADEEDEVYAAPGAARALPRSHVIAAVERAEEMQRRKREAEKSSS